MEFLGKETIEACRECHEVLLAAYWRVDGEVFCGRCAETRRQRAAREVWRDGWRGVGWGAITAGVVLLVEAGLWPLLARLTWPDPIWSLRLELQILVALTAGTVIGLGVKAGSRQRGGVWMQGAAVLLIYAAYAGSVALASGTGWRGLLLAGVGRMLPGMPPPVDALFGMGLAWQMNRMGRRVAVSGPFGYAAK